VIITKYSDAQPRDLGHVQVKGVTARVLIGKDVGASNFFMRVFEIAPGGEVPPHSHAWEHEMFIHSGEAEFYGNGEWNTVSAGCTVFVPPNEEHGIRNPGSAGTLVMVCCVPGGAPEL
jgi:quercetin dioxygenase-like cupin family protein